MEKEPKDENLQAGLGNTGDFSISSEDTKSQKNTPKTEKKSDTKKAENKKSSSKKGTSDPILTADDIREETGAPAHAHTATHSFTRSTDPTSLRRMRPNTSSPSPQGVSGSSVSASASENSDESKKTTPSRAKKAKENQARRSRRRGRQFVGLIIAVLVIVGAATIISGLVTYISQALAVSDDEKAAYEYRIAPLVWFDLLPFEDPAQIDENSLKEALIFGIIDHSGNELQHDANGSAIIPTIDVDAAAAELFGPDFHFTEHAEFTSVAQGITYMYDDTLNAYIVAGTGLELAYAPLVTEVKSEGGGVIRVTVGYISTKSTDGNLLQTLDYDHPARYMDFMFQRDGNQYYLFAMRPNTTAVTSAASSSASSSSSQSASDSSVPSFAPSTAVESALEGGVPEDMAVSQDAESSTDADTAA